MKPGSVCDNNLGYCDALSKCRLANHDTVLNSLISSLLNPSKTLNDVKEWVKTYWWAVLIFVIIFLVLFMLVVYFLSRFLPTTNPNKNMKDEAKVKKNTNNVKKLKIFNFYSLYQKKKKLEEKLGPNRNNEFRRRSQIFTTEISDNVDYERNVPKNVKTPKQRILV